MDIGFIEQKDRQNVLNLMQICAIDMNEAYQLYNNSNKNLQEATKMYFQSGTQNQEQITNNTPQFTNNFPQTNYYNDGDDFDQMYENYKDFLSSGITFESRYEVRKPEGIFSSVKSFFSGSNRVEYNFKQKVEQYFRYFNKKPCTIKFNNKPLSLVIAQSQKFPIIVYVLDFTPQLLNKIHQIFTNQNFEKIINVQFCNFGMDQSYQLEPSLSKFVSPAQNKNSLIIMRLNVFQDIQIVTKIPITDKLTMGQLIKQLTWAKSRCINQQLLEGHLHTRYLQQLRGNYNYVKPVSPFQRIQMKEQRKLREQQEKQFFDSMASDQAKQKKKREESKLQLKKQQQLKQIKSQLQSKKKEQQPPKPIQPKLNVLKQRKQIRDNLKMYTEGMTIKLRFPNGENQILTVSKQQTPKYLYNFIKGLDKDIGFENDEDRKFTIIRPYDKLNLSDNLNKTLDNIFEGSSGQNLVINEQTHG